tara:strand:+ start:595 stop:1893 length:1299 start_codon:yes stop_codon:yes gene_type:complete
MAIVLKKNGRPTKASKALVKKINNFLSTLSEDDKVKYPFDGEVVTGNERLESIWSEIINPKATPELKKVILAEPTLKENEILDRETGEITTKEEIKEEIKEDIQEHTNFVNNKENMIEDATIIDEINSENGGRDINEVPSSFNPLGDPIKQRSYNAPQTTDVGDIPEPDFSNNASAQERLDDIELEEANVEEEIIEEESEEKENEWDNVTNEGMEELGDKDKKLAAQQLVQTVLDGYEMLHELGKTFVKYPEDKLQEKIIKGEIDPTMEIPLDENGTTTNPVEFFQNFNEQAEEAISYDPEFGEKVRPAMERVFSKKGWGMTDEQFLLVAFGKDAAWKGVQIMTLKKTSKGIMDTFVQLQTEKNEAIRQNKRAEQAYEPPLQPDAIVTPPRREPIHEEPIHEEPLEEFEEEFEEEEYRETNGGIGTEIVPIH